MKRKKYQIKIFIIILVILISTSFTQTTEIIIERFKTGEKKIVCKYRGEGLDEKLIERYSFNKNGKIIYFEDFLYLENNPELFTSVGFKKYITGYWFTYNKDKIEILENLRFSNDSLVFVSDVSIFTNNKIVYLDSLRIQINDNNFIIDYLHPMSDTLMSHKLLDDIILIKNDGSTFKKEKNKSIINEKLKNINNYYYNSDITVEASFNTFQNQTTIYLQYYDKIGFQDSSKYFEFNNEDILDLKITSNDIDFQFSKNYDTLFFTVNNNKFSLEGSEVWKINEKKIFCNECDTPPKENLFNKLNFHLPNEWPYLNECNVSISYYITEKGIIRHQYSLIYKSLESKYEKLLKEQIINDLQHARYKPAINDGQKIGCWEYKSIKYSKNF